MLASSNNLFVQSDRGKQELYLSLLISIWTIFDPTKQEAIRNDLISIVNNFNRCDHFCLRDEELECHNRGS